MGANAQTAVPAFTAGQVLTAAQMTQINTGVPVFATTVTRDAAFGGSGEKTLAQGQLCYIEADGKVYVYTGSAWASISPVVNVASFSASGTWTVPTGVTYAIAHMLGGGGGVGAGAGAGGTSSVAFASGTVTAIGGNAWTGNASSGTTQVVSGQANSGWGAWARDDGSTTSTNLRGANGNNTVYGAAVTAGASITVTVGAGGTAGTNGGAGGSGFVWIEYVV